MICNLSDAMVVVNEQAEEIKRLHARLAKAKVESASTNSASRAIAEICMVVHTSKPSEVYGKVQSICHKWTQQQA